MRFEVTKEQSKFIFDNYKTLTKAEIAKSTKLSKYHVTKFYLINKIETPEEIVKNARARTNDWWLQKRLTKEVEEPESKQDYDLRYSTELIRNTRLKFINFCDLPTLRKMYDDDATVNDMAYALNTTKYNVLQGIEVLKMIDNVNMGKKAVDTSLQAPKPEVMPIDKELGNRPPAVYSNSSPYGIARPGC